VRNKSTTRTITEDSTNAALKMGAFITPDYSLLVIQSVRNISATRRYFADLVEQMDVIGVTEVTELKFTVTPPPQHGQRNLSSSPTNHPSRICSSEPQRLPGPFSLMLTPMDNFRAVNGVLRRQRCVANSRDGIQSLAFLKEKGDPG
jgi:hypothetical protein